MHVVWNGYGFREMVTWLSRITHCRGFGVQSPSAYRFIRYVVNEHYPYYAYADLREEFPNIGSTDEKLCRLYFRIANYQQPMTFINIGRSDAALVAYVNAGCRKTRVIDYRDTYAVERNKPYDSIPSPLLFRINLKDVHREFSPCFIDNIPDDSIMILEGIKGSHAAREIWKSMMNDSRTGVTFDLYYCGILFFDKRIKQNYIVNF